MLSSDFVSAGLAKMEIPSPVDVATPRRSTRILIADDHELVRSGFVCLLDLCGYSVVAQASNGQEAVALWRQLQPDVSLLDLRMPVLDGIGAIHAIRALNSQARAVVLSTFDGDEQVTRALNAGACAYLLKSVSPDVLCGCIDAVHSGGQFLIPESTQRRALHSAAPSRTPSHPRCTQRTEEQLTPRERAVLALISQGKSNKGVARALEITSETVKSHLKRVFVKLGSRTRAEAVGRATALGWLAGRPTGILSALPADSDPPRRSITHAGVPTTSVNGTTSFSCTASSRVASLVTGVESCESE
jgi:DNA-binding NarL/FixJ family response regulator